MANKRYDGGTVEDFARNLMIEAYLPMDHWLNLKKNFDPFVHYALKPSMQIFPNGYIDKSYRTFNKNGKMNPSSSPMAPWNLVAWG